MCKTGRCEGQRNVGNGRPFPEANKLSIGEGVTIKGAVVLAHTVWSMACSKVTSRVDNLIVSRTGTISGRISVAANAEIHGQVFEKLDVKGLLGSAQAVAWTEM